MANPDDIEPLATDAEERWAFALHELALQGERDIAAGRSASLAEHRARMRALLRRAR